TVEKRGRLPGKRHISERPPAAELRIEIGHWEMDIVVGAGSNHCIVTLVERVTGATIIGRLPCRKAADVNRRVIEMIEAHRELFITITVDNGRVPRLQGDRSRDRGSYLLRESLRLMGTRHEREHQRAHSPVHPETDLDEGAHAETLQ